jgi:hypothetical protein
MLISKQDNFRDRILSFSVAFRSGESERLKSLRSRRTNMRVTRVLCLFLVISFFLFSQGCEVPYADDSLHTGHEFLIDKYHKVEKELEKSSLTIPFYLESSVGKNASHVDIYGTIEYPFDTVENELQLPTNWCDIVLPHSNVRACTYKKVNDTWLLTLYNVKKFQDPLEDAYQMNFEYRVLAQQRGFFAISLAAPGGPFSTKDHQFGLEAIPLDEDRTFIHLRYSYRYSFLGYFLMKNYFALFGGGRIGFSAIGTDSDGNPVYVDGLRGAVESNVLRYYLTILAYMDTFKIPVEQRFEKRMSQWYDLTARYKRQLFEMERKEYLTFKRQDRESQLLLQGALNRSR